MLHGKNLTSFLILLSFLDYFGVSMVAPQIGLRIRELGASQFLTGLIASSYGGLQLFSSTFHGVGCDKYGRRTILLFCTLLIAASYFVIALSSSCLVMLTIRGVLGVVKHTQSSLKVIGGDFNTGEDRSVFISRINSVSGGAFMLGPLAAAYLSDSFTTSSLLCSGIQFLILVLCYCFVSETLSSTKPSDTDHTVHKLSIWERFKKYKDLRVIMVYRFCAATSVVMLRYFTPLYTAHYFGFSAKDVAYMTSFIGLSGILCSLSAGYVARVVPDKHTLVKYLSLLLNLALILSLLSPNMTCLMATQFLLSFATQNLRIVIDSIILASADDENRGEVYGLGASVVGLGRVGAPLVAGSLAQIHMMLPLMCSLGLALIGCVVLFGDSRTKVKAS